ncbi:TPA: hypothetical protein I7247_14780 [Vibrio vulnificus]|uniref:Uncharacterized protein n=1 Tax=Vibrio parahaemolyticus TaxID=670 RepID=A0A7M1VPP5_VIBPH|nr:hypothetical protein [Vibrio parahaemolyticus]QOS16364.1 hypothetical protein VP52_00012 [Vibrio parahaemolyticus]HAS6339883.1 hypothetical protein [Vibrio vulnificus]HDY7603458.1 hypothetical protein [Vibrio vulnificus]
MKLSNLQSKRIDCILVWGHGIHYLEDILELIRGHDGFNIIKIEKHVPKNLKKFVKEMYSYDYAPFWHLKEKTKYLNTTKKEVCFIFVENIKPNEDYLDEGEFRHIESLTLKAFKEELRDKFNPYLDGVRTHNHVIHATDSESQTNHMLKYLGYESGVEAIKRSKKIIETPYYLKSASLAKIKSINIDNLYCSVVSGESWDNFDKKTVPIQESPQFLGLTQNMDIYISYIKKYRGGALQEDYNVKRFQELSKSFEYLSPPYENSYVLVSLNDDKYVILDGLHRACYHFIKGNREIKVCQITN